MEKFVSRTSSANADSQATASSFPLTGKVSLSEPEANSVAERMDPELGEKVKDTLAKMRVISTPVCSAQVG